MLQCEINEKCLLIIKIHNTYRKRNMFRKLHSFYEKSTREFIWFIMSIIRSVFSMNYKNYNFIVKRDNNHRFYSVHHKELNLVNTQGTILRAIETRD